MLNLIKRENQCKFKSNFLLSLKNTKLNPLSKLNNSYFTSLNTHKLSNANFSSLNNFPKFNFSKRGSKEWLDRHTNDTYVKKSKTLDYRSRSAFKLKEIHQKYKLLRPGQKVLDVGSAPGGWSQVITELTKSSVAKPNVVAVDILRMDPVDGVHFIQGDMNKQEVHDSILEKNGYQKFDLVLSDMCPEFTGTKSTDHFNLIELNRITIDFASKVLKRNGNFIMKTFEGTLQKKMQEGIQNYYHSIHRFKPASSRSESSELYLVCMGYLENPELKKEAEELSKITPEEFHEKNKNAAIRTYRMAKLNKMTLIEDLDNMKDSIVKKFKIDPEKIKVDPLEEEEMAKIIEDENERIHLELYGRAYKPIKQKTIGEFVENYQKEMKEYDEKLKAVLKKDVVDFEELEEFFKEDADKQHMDEVASAAIKEVDFLYEKIKDIEDRIQDEDAEDIVRPDGKENETLAKYKRWENLLKDIEAKVKEDKMSNKSDETNIDYHGDSKKYIFKKQN